VDNLAKQRKLALEDAPLWHHAGRWCGAALVLALTMAAAHAIPRAEPTVDELKARVSSANTGEKAKLCIQIAEKQLGETDKLYATDDVEKAQTALSDVVSYSELARDYSIQSHKHEKQIEISVRAMTRKLNDIVHTLGRDEQVPVKNAIERLEHVRDDLLGSMFPKGAK
jgi:hypothetical protein